jgi:hypothetical protein
MLLRPAASGASWVPGFPPKALSCIWPLALEETLPRIARPKFVFTARGQGLELIVIRARPPTQYKIVLYLLAAAKWVLFGRGVPKLLDSNQCEPRLEWRSLAGFQVPAQPNTDRVANDVFSSIKVVPFRTARTAFAVTALIVVSSQPGARPYVQNVPSFDCTYVQNAVAAILCSGPEGASADWDYNSASWAVYFATDEKRRASLDAEQRRWRQSVDRACALPRPLTPQEQADQAMVQAWSQTVFGGRIVLQGRKPITRSQVNSVLNAYHRRGAQLRSPLSGDALAESRLTPAQHARIQEALAEKGFLSDSASDEIDAEFGSITRSAIRRFQESQGALASGFLSRDQRTVLLETPEEREAKERAAVAETARLEAEARRAAQAADERKARDEVEKARLEAEAAAAKEWRMKVDEARFKGEEYAKRSSSTWSLAHLIQPRANLS